MKQAVDLLCLAVAKIVIGLMGVLPERPAFLLSRFVISVVLLIFRRSEEVGLRNLELAFPEKSEAERKEILHKSYDVLARNLLSFARIPRLTREVAEQTTDYRDTVDLLKRLKAESPSGVVIATAHFGSFEGIIQRSALLYEPGAILARAFDLPRLDAWWNARRELHGNRVFARAGGYKGIIHNLNEGRTVAVLFDQNVKANYAVFVPFFGIQAAATRSLALALEKTGAKVCFALPYEDPPGYFRVISEEIKAPEGGSREERGEALMTELHRALERAIRKHPEQWFWIHRRWKTRPPGEAETIYTKQKQP